MADTPINSWDGQTFAAAECKFTVESSGNVNSECVRIDFEGYATAELIGALISAIEKVVGE